MIEPIQRWEWSESLLEQKLDLLEAKLAEVVEAINAITERHAPHQ